MQLCGGLEPIRLRYIGLGSHRPDSRFPDFSQVAIVAVNN
jgi:hypothetical protein